MTLGRAKRGWFDRKRADRRQRSAHVEALANPDRGTYRHTIERLENRILMSADPLHFLAAPNIAQDLTLSLVDKAGIPTIQIMDTASSLVLAQQAKSATSSVDITLSKQADTIRIKNDFSAIVPVTVDGLTGTDTLIGPSLASGATYTITGVNAGSVAGVSFSHISAVQGASGSINSFIFNPGGVLSAGIDGGAGGQNTLTGSSTGGTFTLAAADAGTVKEAGASVSTAFSNVGFLQGGSGADIFQFKTGASLSVGLDGGGGANAIIGPATSTTYTVSGSDSGTVAGTSFSNIGKLQGANGISDQFNILSNSASLSVGIDGGTGSVNTLTGPSTGATFEITGRDSGHVGGVSFTHVGQLIGADNAPDTFLIDAGASLSTGLDGGAGGGNQLDGPDTGATFTVSSADGGRIQETGAAVSTVFKNIGQLQGGSGADSFLLTAAGGLSTGIDGGGGADTIVGPAVSTTFNVSGSDAGTVAGINFTRVGKLQGANGVSDQFNILSNGASLSVGIDGGTGSVNTLTGPSTGATFEITGRDSGRVGGVSFTHVGRLIGADNAPDTFIVDAGGSLSNSLDGGVGGGNQLDGPNTGATFTVSSVDAGRIQETGAAVSTVFKNVGQLQGGSAADSFVLTAAGGLSTGLDGGGGVNTLHGPAGATYTVTGTDTGTLNTTSFSHIGKLLGTSGAADAFVIGVGAALSIGIDGVGAGRNVLIGPSTGTTFTVTGRDTGFVPGVSFTNVGSLRGADNAPDIFLIMPTGSLTTGIDGGAGDGNSLFGPSTGATFTVTNTDRGTIQETGAAFVTAFRNVGRLIGADNISDTFVINPAGSLSGGLEGGADSNDILRLFGTVNTATYTATGPQSGLYQLDSRQIAFGGIETIDDEMSAANRIVNGTDGADIMTISQAGTRVTVSASTMDPITFTQPTVSLTVNGAGGPDSVAIISDLSLPHVALKLTAETITVVGHTVDTSGGANGSISFLAQGLDTTLSGSIDGVAGGALGGAAALITIANSTLNAGGAMTLLAQDSYTNAVTAQAIAAQGLLELATATLTGSTLITPNAVQIGAATVADLSDIATGSTSGSASNDAAVAVTAFTVTPTVSVTDTSITSGKSISLSATSTVSVITTADATASSAGGAAANTIGNLADTVTVAGNSQLKAGTGASVGVTTTSKTTITTKALASLGGVSGATPRTGMLLSDGNAQTSEGAVTAAAAVALNLLQSANSVSLAGTTTVAAPAGFTLASADTHTIQATADSSATSTSTGLAAAVAINNVTATSDSMLLGALTFTGNQVTVDARESSTVTASAVSGVGSADATGLAGALAINNVSARPTASVEQNASLVLNGASLTVSAEITSAAVASATATVNGGSSAVGVGASVALNFTNNNVDAVIAGQVSGANRVTLSGTGQDSLTTVATGGVAGGTAVTPVVAISSASNKTTVDLANGPAMTTTGAVQLVLDRRQTNTTTADASTGAAQAGIGAALALSFGFQDALAQIERTLSARGVVILSSAGVSDTTKATASARGVAANDARGNSKGQMGHEVGFVDNRMGNSASTPDPETSSGAFGLSAALAFNSVNSKLLADIAANANVTSSLGITVQALSDHDASATADASVAKGGDVGIGAALAVNDLSPATTAEIDGSVVASRGVFVQTGPSANTASPGVNTIVADAISGAGAGSVAVSGALGLNLDNLVSRALVSAGASVTSGTLALNVNASQNTDTTTTGTADGSTGQGSGVGVGVGLALTIANNDVTARIDGQAAVSTGAGGLTLAATSSDAVHGNASAGSASGEVGVAPSTFILISKNATLAELASGSGLSLRGPVSLNATHTLNVDGTAAAAGSGSQAGIGVSFALGIVEDQAEALLSRSLTMSGAGANVSALASNIVNVALTATASPAGGTDNGASTADGQINQQLNFANGQKGGAPATAHNAEVSDPNGRAHEVGVAGAISLAIVNSQSLARIPADVTIVTTGTVTVQATGAASQSVKADASKLDKSIPREGVGVAVALNMANATTTAEVDGTVTSAGLAIRALAPTDPAQQVSNTVATAVSGAGASNVGVAGAFAANFANLKSTALLTTSATETAHGNVEIRAQLFENPQAVATSSVSASASGSSGGGDAVGVGVSVALNILKNQSSATLPDAVTVTGAGNLTIAASDVMKAKTWAVSGSDGGGVGITPVLALLVAENTTTATLGTGDPLAISGSFSLSVTDDVTGDTRADAGAGKTSSVGIGAAVALNILADVADASPSRAIAAGLDVSVAADLVADVSAKAVASASGVSGQGGPNTTDGQVAGTTKFANQESGASTTAPQVAKANGGAGGEGSVGIAAALALDLVNTHAHATLPGSITVTSGRDVSVTSTMDVDGLASADASTVKQQTGIGAAVALNVINADNTALIIAPTSAHRNVTVSATMSPNGDGTDTFLAQANSGAGSSQVGVAGAAAFNILNLPTKAQILTSLAGGSGGIVTIAAANKSAATTLASSKATTQGQASGNSGVGVGASFALSLLNLPTTAELPDNVTVTGAGGLSITAAGDHSATTTAEAGSSSDVAVSPAVAITIAGSDTTARLGAGPQLTTLGTGSVVVSANHAGNYQTKADAQAGGSDVAVGAAIALGLTFESASATTLRNINAAGDVRIEAINAMASGAAATGGAKGNSTGAGSSDQEGQSTLDNNSNVANDSAVKAQPGGHITLPKAADSDNTASQTAAAQASGRGTGQVGVGAAVGINVVTTAATASIPAGLSVRSRAGQIVVDSALQIDGTAIAVGTAIADPQKDTSVGAGVALNIINATNAATIGDRATINAANGVSVTATMAPHLGDSTNDFIVQSAAVGGAQKYGIAGAVSIDAITLDTRAELGQSDNILAGAGAVTVVAQSDNRAQNLAGAGAFGSTDGVGAAVVVQSATISTNAIVHQNARVDGAGGLSVTAETSYVPEPDNFKGFGFALTSGAFGGAGSDDGAAIGGSVAVNVLNFDTEARLDTNVAVNQRAAATGDVVVEAQSTVSLFGGAGGVGVALGNVGIGVGIDVTIVNQKTLAMAADKVRISTAGNVSIDAISSDQQTSVAGSFGLTAKNGGAGSVVVNLFNLGSDPSTGTRAILGADTVVQAGGAVSVVAFTAYPSSEGGLIPDSLTIIAGSVAGANGTGVGIADANAIRHDWFYASVGDRAQVTTGGDLRVAAGGSLNLSMFAAAGAGGLEDGAAGSLTVSTLDEAAVATIEQSATIVGTTSSANILVTAEGETRIVKVAGAIGFGADVGVGAGLDVGVLTKNTIASIGAHSQISTGGSVEVTAFSGQNVNAYAASGAGGSDAAVAGSVGVQIETVTTRAFIEGTTSGAATTVTADGNVFVQDAAADEMNLFAGGLSLAGDVAVGASALVLVINKVTEAFIGQNAVVVGLGLDGTSAVLDGGSTVTYVDPAPSSTPPVTTNLTSPFTFQLNGAVAGTQGVNQGVSPTVGDPNAGKQLQVTATTVNLAGVAVAVTNFDDIGELSLTGGASGSVAVNVAGVVNVSNITTTAHIDKGASINQAAGAGAGQDVLVVARNEYHNLIVSGAASIAGDVAVAPSVGVNSLNLTASALIAGTVKVSAADSVGVKARSSEDIQTVVVGIGGSGTATVAGSPSILVLNDHVAAHIGDVGGKTPDVAATVQAGGSVVVQALDDTSVLDSDGSLGIGGDAGVGAGVAINMISKDTSARIAAGSIVDAAANTGASGVAGLGGVDGRFDPTQSDAGLIVVAGTSEWIGSTAIAGAGGIVGGSGAVNLNLISSNTVATIGDNSQINQILPGSASQDVVVAASNDVLAVAVTGALGVGGVGLAGALGIGIVHNGTQALIGNNVAVTAQNLISVEAVSHQAITAVDVSGGLAGGFGGAMSFGTWVVNSDYNSGGGSSGESSWAGTYQSTVTGGALGGFQGALGGYQPIAYGAADVGGNSINLHTATLQTGEAVVYHANGHATGSLSDGQTYYLIKTGSTTYLLASSLANADAGIAISVGATNGGAFELADNARSDTGLNNARNDLVAGAPTAQLSSSLSATGAPGGTVALVGTGSTFFAGGGMDVQASNSLTFVQVTGQVSYSGGTGIGGAFSTLVDNETVLAQVADGDTIVVGGTGLDVNASSRQSVVQIAAGAGVAGGTTISGSGTVTILNESTRATLGNNEQVTGSITADGVYPDVKVLANDATSVVDVAGAIGFGGAAAIGAGADVIVLSKTTLATIGTNDQITTQGSVELRANTSDDIVSVAAIGQASNNAAVSLAASVVVANITTQAYVAASPATTLNADGNVIVEAVATSDYNLWGIAASLSGTVAASGAAAVPVITKNVLAEIGDGATVTGRGLRNGTSVADGSFGQSLSTSPTDVSTDKAQGGNAGLGSPNYNNANNDASANKRQNYNADQNYSGDAQAGHETATPNVRSGFYGVAVSATNADKIGSTGISIGAAGNVAVSLTGSVQVVNDTVQARVGQNTGINTLGGSPAQSVLVAAGDDFRSLNIAGGASIAGIAAVTPVAAVQIVSLNTSAIVDNGATVDAGDSVLVTAHANEQVTEVAASATAAAFAGVSVSPNVMVLDSQTVATIGGSGPATVNAGGSVGVLADDQSRFINVAASFGAGFVGLSLGGDIVLVTKNTQALITDGSSITANAAGSQIGNVLDNLGSSAQNYAVQDRVGTVGGVVVQATSSETMTDLAGAIAVGAIGLGITGDIIVVNSDTLAHIGANTVINSGGAVIISAANTLDVFALAGAAGVGVGAAGGAVTVGIVHNGVEASIGDGANISSGGDTEVIALSRKNVDSFDIAGSAGGIALAGSIGIWAFGGAVSGSYSYDDRNGQGNANGNKSDDALGHGASGWNTNYDSAASGSGAPGGSYGSILSGQSGSGGNTSRIAAANANAQPLVAAAKPKTSVTAQLNGEAGDTVARIRPGVTIVADGNVVVRAKDATTVTQTAGSFTGGVVSVGVPISITTFNGGVTADIAYNASIFAGGDITVEAAQTKGFDGFVFAGQAGLGALGAQILIVNDNTDDVAAVGAGTNLFAVGNIGVNATAQQRYSGGAFGATLSEVGAGASVAIVNSSGAVQAFMDANSVVALGSVSVVAVNDVQVDLQTFGVGIASGASLSGAIAVANVSGLVEAHISDGTSTTALGDVTVAAVDLAGANVSAYAISIAGGVGLGIAVADAEVNPSVTANAGGSITVGGTFTTLADFNTDAAGNKIGGRGAESEAFSVGAALVAGIAGAVSISNTRPTVLAELDDGATVAPYTSISAANVVVRSLSGSDAIASAQGIGVGALAGLGASVAIANVGGSNMALATGANLRLGTGTNNRVGDVTVDARSADNASAETIAASGGIFAGFAINLANADVETSVQAEFGLGAQIFARSLTVNAGESGGSHARSKGLALSGKVAGAASQASATFNVPVEATVDGSTIDVLNALGVLASIRQANTDATAIATGAGLLFGGDLNSATAQTLGHTFAVLQNATVVGNSANQVRIHADSASDAQANSAGAGFGILGVGSTEASAINNLGTEARIGAGVQIGTGQQGDFAGSRVQSVEVSATSVGTGAVDVAGAAAGIATLAHVKGMISVTPFAHAYIKDNAGVYASGSVTVSASNYAEGDGSLAGRTVSAIDFGSMELDHTVSQDAEAIVYGGATIMTGGDVTVVATGGDPALKPGNYDGISTVKGGGFSIGLIADSNAKAIANLTSTVIAQIRNGTPQAPTAVGTGGSLLVTATATAQAAATTNDTSGDLLGDLTTTTTNAIINATTEALIGLTDQDAGQGSLATNSSLATIVMASANLKGSVSSNDSGGAGFFAGAETDGQATSTYTTLAGFGQGVTSFAQNVLVNVNTTHNETTTLNNAATAGGAGISKAGNTNSGSFAKHTPDNLASVSGIIVGGDTTVQTPGSIALVAQISNSSLTANSTSDSRAVASDSEATATAIGDDQVRITLAAGSNIIGQNGVVISAGVNNYSVNTSAVAHNNDKKPATSTNTNYANVNIDIDAQAGARVEAGLQGQTPGVALRVLTNLNVIRSQNGQTPDGGGPLVHDYFNGQDKGSSPLNGQDGNSVGDNSLAIINWNADVVLDKVYTEKDLVIGSNGVVTEANGISVDGYPFSFFVPGAGIITFPAVGHQTGSVIHVGDITSENTANSAEFDATQTNFTKFPDGSSNVEGADISDRNVITGTAGTWFVGEGAGLISIINNSSNSLEINNIETIPQSTSTLKQNVTINVRDAAGLDEVINGQHYTPFNFAVRPIFGSPSVQISNHTFQGGGNILLNGVVDNPLGSTFIDAGGGSTIQENKSGVVRTLNLEMSANGNIGVRGNPINIELVQSAGHVPSASFSAGLTLALDITTRLRDPGAATATVNIRELSAGFALVTFHQASDDIFVLPAAGIVVEAMKSPANDVAQISTPKFYSSFYYPNTSGPYSTDVWAAFATSFGFFSAPVTYNIAFGNSVVGALIEADPAVTINKLAGPAPSFASLLVPSLNMSAVVTPLISGSAATTNVTLSVPMVSTAIETPLEQILGQAQTTFFGVTETDLFTLAAAAALQPSSNLLEEDFLALEPGLLPIDGFTKPNMVWS